MRQEPPCLAIAVEDGQEYERALRGFGDGREDVRLFADDERALSKTEVIAS